MPDDPNIPVLVAEPKSPLPKFLCWLDDNASDFLKWVGKHLSIDGSVIGRATIAIRSITTLGAEDRDKIWIRPAGPASVGIFVNGAWEHFYQFPLGSMAQFAADADLDQGWEWVTSEEKETLGLVDGSATDGASDVSYARWAKFNPPTIE